MKAPEHWHALQCSALLVRILARNTWCHDVTWRHKVSSKNITFWPGYLDLWPWPLNSKMPSTSTSYQILGPYVKLWEWWITDTEDRFYTFDRLCRREWTECWSLRICDNEINSWEKINDVFWQGDKDLFYSYWILEESTGIAPDIICTSSAELNETNFFLAWRSSRRISRSSL